MEELLQSQQGKAGEITQLISNYKKDSQDRKTKRYLEARMAALKKLYNEYVDSDNAMRNLQPPLELKHQYHKDRQVVLEIFTKNMEDMRQRLNDPHAPSTPTLARKTIQPTTEGEGNIVPLPSTSENALKGSPEHETATESQHGQLPVLNRQLRQQDIRIRSLYREIRAAEDILTINNRSRTVLKHKIKIMDRIMMQVTDLHEQISMQISEEQEENFNYFVDRHYENVNNAYDKIAITIATLLEEDQKPSQAKPMEIRLPPVEIPRFHGDHIKWIGFADTFKRLVHDNNQLTNTHKINYLKSHVEGSAARLLSHLEPTGENYTTAWEILENRFNNRRVLVSNLLNTLINQQSCITESAAGIKNLHDTTTECLYAIRNTGINIDTWSPFIIFTLLKKLDSESRRLYESSLEKPREFQETVEFLKFLERRFQSLEAIGSNRSTSAQQVKSQPQPLRHAFVAATQPTNICVCCQKNHNTYSCSRFKGLSVSERNQMVMLHNLCRNCLSQNHTTTGCSSKISCFTCKGRHHTLLHVNNQDNSVTKLNISTIDKDCGPVLLATALVKVQNIFGRFEMLRALIDPGSQATFVTEQAAQQLGLPRTRVLTEVSGISATKGRSHQQISIAISPRFSSVFKIQTNALVLKSITKPLPDKTLLGLDSELQKGVILADPTFDTPGPIDLLIGADIYGEMMLEGVKRDPQHKCIAQRTELGWIISGRLNQTGTPNTRLYSHVTLADIDKQLKRFWESEELHPKRNLTTAEIECEQYYEETYKRLKNGRFEVRIPLDNAKLKEVGIGESKGKAAARLLQIEKRFKKDEDFKNQYHQFINEYIQLNHMELIKYDSDSDLARIYYMPHHSVVKEDSTTTKLRVVFDASCKTTTGTSINEMMHVGPTLQDNLATILIRWKKHRYVIAADIEKMFRQIQVASQDQDFQRILWRTNPNMPMRSYRLKTVTYGTAAATYLATKTLQQLAKDEATRYPIGSNIALKDFYVDDLLSGANTIAEANIAQKELRELLSRGGFNLRKWASNNTTILEELPENLKETGLHSIKFDETIKTLGLLWNSVTDTFQFKVSLKPETKQDISKRTILSESSRLFDPLGWLAPVVIQAKILLQDLWASGVGWDEKLHSTFEDRWLSYKQELPQLEKIRINRWTNYTSQAKVELHGFCDASNLAYAAVVYSKVNNIITLIAAKTRVAPLNQTISLPRLELNAALLLSKLLKNVLQALDIDNNISTFCWSDSTAVLGWIKGKPQNHKTFVANRITEIQSSTNPSQWYHIVSNENPADCASRGLNPVQLLTHNIWWEGPIWLKGSSYPTTNIESQAMEQAGSMERKPIITLLTAVENPVIEFDRFSSLQRLVRTIAYCLRVPSNIRSNTRNTSNFTPEELVISLRGIIKIVQREAFETELKGLKSNQNLKKGSTIISLTPFIDGNDVLRVGGRLSNSDLSYEETHPIILPRSHKLSKLIVKDAHLKTLHGGHQATLSYLRAQYWIINVKNTIRQSIHECIICTRSRKLASHQLMGLLPKERVNPAPPFTNSGVDYAGPISIKLWKGRCNRTTKGYIAIFICLATKAIHLEVVSDLSTEAFLAAYKRFVSRRGICLNIFSDCGTNFVGADKQLQRQAKQQKAEINNKTAQIGTTWHFVPPGSPHFGGLWEAGVKSTKQRLRNMIGTHTLTYEELSTLLAQIEACLNSRPLAPLSNDPEDDGYLSPAHFLIGRSMIALPQPDIASIQITTRWNLLTKLTQGFWKKWRTEYLSRLQHRPKWLKEQPNFRVGELVILRDEHSPPTHWPLARVVQIHPGQDGLVRVVSIIYKGNTFKRNVTKLCRLPITNDSKEHMDLHQQNSDCVRPTTTKDGNKPQQQQISGLDKATSDTTAAQESDARLIDTKELLTRNDNQTRRLQPHRQAKYAATTNHLGLAVFSICCILGLAQAQINITPFNHSTGIYFENLGKLEVVAMKWTLVVYYNMTSYWEEIEVFKEAQVELKAACKDFASLRCDVILQQLQWQFQNLVEENDLLLSSNKERRRTKRGLGDTIGLVLGDMFGVLTQREADQYEAQFEDVNNNENHLMALMRNQTSIIDNTVKLVKHNSNLTMTSLNNLIKDQQRLRLEMALLDEYRTQEERARSILMSIIELTLILKNLEDTQHGLLDVIYDSHHSILHPSILAPSQLEDQLQGIRQNIPASITIPGHDLHNLLHIYQTMNVRSRVTQRSVIFEITIPLSFAVDYNLLAIVPVPDINQNNVQSHIVTSTKYLAMDNHREHFAFLTTEELNRCQIFQTSQFLCEISPIFNTMINESQCEVAILQRKSTLDTFCKVESINAANHWIKLHAENHWIYVVPNETMVDVICGSKVQTYNFQGSGLVIIDAGCALRDENVQIIAVGTARNNISNEFHKLSNSISGAINLKEFSSKIKSRTSVSDNLKLMTALDTANLEKELDIIKENQQLPTRMNQHDVHHYTVSYSIIGILIICFVICYFKLRSKPQQIPPLPPSSSV